VVTPVQAHNFTPIGFNSEIHPGWGLEAVLL